ncbi:MAG: sigma-70 family RNA polymerase sigma factor [Leptospiraceae bacterium]|nr:sigma-70 family RNA polymerase sigma factor [Leptospiraceae bacterium]
MSTENSNERRSVAFEADARLVAAAMRGDLGSMEQLLGQVQNRIFGLALKFLWNTQDAEDASQEILLRIITHLHTFRAESTFSTWAFRVAVNYLSNVRRSRMERRRIDFAVIENELSVSQTRADGGSLEGDFVEQVESHMMLEHVRAACTHAILQALEREARIAFILGVVFEMPGPEAAYVLNITPQAYRQRLHRARTRMEAFLTRNCGVMNPDAGCRCARRVDFCTSNGVLTQYIQLADALRSDGKLDAINTHYRPDYTAVGKMAAVFRNRTCDAMPDRVLNRIRRLFHTNQLRLLRDVEDSHDANSYNN